MGKSKELLFIRYLGLAILMIDVSLNSKIFNVLAIAGVLLIIINNNLRLFYIKKEKLYLMSVFIEIIFAAIGLKFFGGKSIFYFIGVAIDVYSLNKIPKYIGITLSLITILTLGNITDFFIMVVLFIFLNYINELYVTKIDAQKLYDKLRVSEEKLKLANKELENYALSIEELTLLKERNRISREIHDSVGHALSTTMIQLSAMEAIGKKEKSALEPMAKRLREFINESFQDVKAAVREIKPKNYGEYEKVIRIQEVLRNFEKMTGMKIDETIIKGDWTLSEKEFNNIYRMTQEILSNALRHGKAKAIKIVMNFTKHEFVMSFKDDGIGAKEIQESGVGLKSIRERTEEMGGHLDIKAKENEGFFIKITIPKREDIEV